MVLEYVTRNSFRNLKYLVANIFTLDASVVASNDKQMTG